jgi:hypothetical protein
MKNWDKILKDFARKCKGGAPDMTNPRHLALLRESLIKFGWKEFATNEFIGNLREGSRIYKSNWPGGNPPEGVEIHTGKGGGKYYDSDDYKPDKKKSKDPHMESINRIDKIRQKINEKVLEDVDYLLADARLFKVKNGAGSNSATLEEANALYAFTEARMAQEEDREEFKKNGGKLKDGTVVKPPVSVDDLKKYDEENPPHIHRLVKRRVVTEKELNATLELFESQMGEVVNPRTGETAFENFVKRYMKGGAVDAFLTKGSMITVYKTNEDGSYAYKTGPDGEPILKNGKKQRIRLGDKVNLEKMKGPPPQPGWIRLQGIIKNYLENDGKSVVTGKPLPFSKMEVDHRSPFGSAQDVTMDEMGLSVEDYNRISGNKANLTPEDLKLRKEFDEKYRVAATKLDDPSNHDLMEVGCNQLKNDKERQKLLDKILAAIEKDPKSEELENKWTNERNKYLIDLYKTKFESGDFSILNERDINKMDIKEQHAVMKAFNYYHPNADEIKLQMYGDESKGIQGDPDYYDKVKKYWAKQNPPVILPDNPDNIDFTTYPHDRWMNRYVQPKKKAKRGRAVSRTLGPNRKFIADHMRSKGVSFLTEEQMEKQDKVTGKSVDKGRQEVRVKNAKNKIDLLKQQLKNKKMTGRTRKNRQKELDDLDQFVKDNEE